MWLSPHRCVLLHISVEITKHVWENPHRQVLGFFHTCLVKHTHRLISPWANGGLRLTSILGREWIWRTSVFIYLLFFFDVSVACVYNIIHFHQNFAHHKKHCINKHRRDIFVFALIFYSCIFVYLYIPPGPLYMTASAERELPDSLKCLQGHCRLKLMRTIIGIYLYICLFVNLHICLFAFIVGGLLVLKIIWSEENYKFDLSMRLSCHTSFDPIFFHNLQKLGVSLLFISLCQALAFSVMLCTWLILMIRQV